MEIKSLNELHKEVKKKQAHIAADIIDDVMAGISKRIENNEKKLQFERKAHFSSEYLEGVRITSSLFKRINEITKWHVNKKLHPLGYHVSIIHTSDRNGAYTNTRAYAVVRVYRPKTQWITDLFDKICYSGVAGTDDYSF
jgi:hypothetical protein